MSVLFKENEIFDACRVLFGPDIHLSREFLDYLQTSGAQSAYRRRAKEVHPDLVTGEDEQLQKKQARLFQQLAEAFEIVTGFLNTREIVAASPPRPSARSKPQPKAKTTSHETKSRQNEDHDGFYRGGIPARPMEIGLYLYYRGAVSYRDLMAALLWQRRQRPSVGSIARRWGWLSAEQVKVVLRCSSMGRFGDRAVQLDFLNSFQVRTLLYFQRCHQQRLGDYFVERRILKEGQVERLVAELDEHNRRFRSRKPPWQGQAAV